MELEEAGDRPSRVQGREQLDAQFTQECIPSAAAAREQGCL